MTMFANDRQERETIAGLKEELKQARKENNQLLKRNAELREVADRVVYMLSEALK